MSESSCGEWEGYIIIVIIMGVVEADHSVGSGFGAGHYHYRPGYSDKKTSRKRSNQRTSTRPAQVPASSLPALKADQSIAVRS